jgi:hypothetical protein
VCLEWCEACRAKPGEFVISATAIVIEASIRMVVTEPVDFRPTPCRVADDVIGDLSALYQRAEARLLDCRDMDEHIVAAPGRNNETVTFCHVKPLYCTARHVLSP